METLETTVREHCANLLSSRASDRKKSAETLKDFLSRNALGSLLSKNTKKRNGFTWNSLFESIEDYLLKEAETFETSKTFNTSIGPLCANLLHLCVSGANKGQAYIKCENIMSACLTVLKDSRLTKAFGDAYLNLLCKHVLPQEYYISFLTPANWEDLLDVCIATLGSSKTKLDDFTKLRLVLLILKNGVKSCQIIVPIRDSMSKLKTLRVVNDKKLQEVMIDITIILLETLSPECRLTMCEYTETVLTSLLSFYDQNMDQKKKSSYFNLLELSVTLHHPEGKFQGKQGSLAENWSIWNKHLHSMLEIICLEGQFLQKPRKQGDVSKYCDQYFSLSAAVYFQIFNLYQDDEENDAGNTSKRPRVALNKNIRFSDLTREMTQNLTPWMGIIYMYTKRYGGTITSSEYLLLLNALNSLMSDSNNNLVWNTYSQVVSCTVKSLVELLNPTDHGRTQEHEQRDEQFLLLWNSCVRHSTSLNSSHEPVHTVMHLLLESHNFKFQNIQPLIKLYYELGMPVSNSSVKTLNIIFKRFFNKCSFLDERLKCLLWLSRSSLTDLEPNIVRELLLRLLLNVNIQIKEKPKEPAVECDNLYDVLFKSTEKSILFSEFCNNIDQPLHLSTSTSSMESVGEMIIAVDIEISKYLRQKMSENTKNLRTNSIELVEYVKFLDIVLSYLDIILECKIMKQIEVETSEVHCVLNTSLRLMYLSLKDTLKNDNVTIPSKITMLNSVRKILCTDYDLSICETVRSCIAIEFFHCTNNVLNMEDKPDEELVLCDKEEIDTTSPSALKRNCMLLLASYCRKQARYRDEILDIILDPKLYNYDSSADIDCVFECIELLCQSKEEAVLDRIFRPMQFICRFLFRDSNVTFKMLKILEKTISDFWSHNYTKQNCFIMVKGYLERCTKLYYPPHVAALIYKCAAKLIVLCKTDTNYDVDMFMKALVDKTKGDIHSLRLYCAYTLKLVTTDLSDIEIENYLNILQDIFVIDCPQNKPLIIKDESANRTSTLLHSYWALVQTRRTLISKVITSLLQIQKEKKLSEELVMNVLNKISYTATNHDINVYLNKNMLSILNFWFLHKYSINDLPLNILGVNNRDDWIKDHMKLIICAEMFFKDGDVTSSKFLEDILNKYEKTSEEIFEDCFVNIISLCLPYVVADKYEIEHSGIKNLSMFQQLRSKANKMFQLSRQVLDNKKWNCLFVDTVAELILLAAVHLSDPAHAEEMFQISLPRHTETYYYETNIFCAILQFFGELTDENILQYLCENQSVAIFKILFKLWENILQENVFEFKVLFLHAFLTLTKQIPTNHNTDAFICNFVCKNLTKAIELSNDKQEIRVFAQALKSILQHYLPLKVNELRPAISHLSSILMMKKDDGFKECCGLLDYLIVDMKDCLKESEDVIDFIHSMSQGTVDNNNCSSFLQFSHRLRTHALSLNYPSHETLLNLHKFLKNNKQYINELSDNLDGNGFSESCDSSLFHLIINSLSNILKTASDHKSIIEACNCLSVIGTYDLKTLVTVAPPDTSQVADVSPILYFVHVVLKSLADVMFDKGPTLTNKVVKALNCLLKFQDVNEINWEGMDEIKKLILKPFESSETDNVLSFHIEPHMFDLYNKGMNIWLLEPNETHTQWLTRVTTKILDLFDVTNYIKELQAVCLSEERVCQDILPSLVGLLLHTGSKIHAQVIGVQIINFFKHVWEITFDHNIENSDDIIENKRVSNVLHHNHKMVIQYMLKIVNFVRLQKDHYKTRQSRSAETFNYLNIEYDKVAWAATIADQNLLAIYYGELWAMAQNDRVPPSSPDVTTSLDGGRNLQRIFRKCFVSIGEMDALDGCGTAHLTIEEERRKHLLNTGEYTDALLLHDIALSCEHAGFELQSGTLRSLKKSGLYHLALQYIKSLPENDDLNDIKYEILSNLGDWSDLVDVQELEKKSKERNCKAHSIIKAFRYACLKDCITIQYPYKSDNRLVTSLNRAKLCISQLCRDINMENCQNIYKVVAKLHLFNDIEDYYNVRTRELGINELLTAWQVQSLPAFHDFKHLEDLVSQRNLMLKHAATNHYASLQDVVSLQLQYAELGLGNGRVQMAQRLLAVVKKLHSSEEVALVESKISWASGHSDIALSLLRNIVGNQENERITATSLRQYGLWMAESRLDSPKEIIDKYLKKSLEVLNNTDDVKTRLKLYNDIAKFTDAEYKKVVTYMNSSIFQNKLECLKKMEDTVAGSQRTQQNLSSDERRALNTNNKFKQLEAAEIDNTKAEKENFLHSAMRYYLLSLAQCDENNLSIFRVISLWLDNTALEMVEGQRLQDMFDAIPSRKFITVLPQLAPRLTNDNTPFANNLKRIIKRCAQEHPHHTLPILFSLKNSDKDSCILNASAGASDGALSRPQEPRVLAAESLVRQLAGSSTQLAVIIAQMEKMCDAMISLANFTMKTKEQKQKIPAAENINKLGKLDAIPVPTVTIPIKADCDYKYLPTLLSFENYFELVGGINCPKKISCRSSNGSRYILLVKGKDDLRQDAVMQQVFNIVNTLLEKDAITSRNKLLIRTYKVVPMSNRSGVLEWCVGTIPLGSFLVGDQGAHSRYRPQDITCSAAREKMTYCHKNGKSNEEKLTVFKAILKAFKPVFHYFFTEHYLDPVTWYERRLAYTKSVASSSMVGYVMGLGDRHVQNILVDEKTAEVVHIDFGYAFDQGKILQTPETVPFRLTQDMIAGFGSCGVEGVFRSCCEKTMQLLRDNQETLLTILEVLLYDPLYSLTSSRHNLQTTFRNTSVVMSGSDRHHLAERALLGVSSKLGGSEAGAGGVAVPGQVARLLHSATDPANLARLFPGWQPYL